MTPYKTKLVEIAAGILRKQILCANNDIDDVAEKVVSAVLGVGISASTGRTKSPVEINIEALRKRHKFLKKLRETKKEQQ